MVKHLKFGGKNLKKPAHTWYMLKTGGQVDGDVGDVVDPETMKDPEYYIKAGFAEMVDVEEAPAKPAAAAPAKAKETKATK